jgi:hypothetical protein
VDRAPAEGHYGLALMHESLACLHGVMRLESAPGRGTRLQFCVPQRAADADSGAWSAWLQSHDPSVPAPPGNDLA